MADKYFFLPKKIVIFVLIAANLLYVRQFSLALTRCYPLKAQEFHYVPDAQRLTTLSPGIKSGLADFFYIQGVMAVGDSLSTKVSNIKWIQDNFSAAILLDNNFIEAYFFAGEIIARNRETLRKGNEFLLTYGYLAPNEWKIPYWIGFNFYELGMYAKAIEFFQKASKFPSAPQFLQSNQSMFYYKAAMARMGVAYFEDLLHKEKDPQKLVWIDAKVKWLKSIVFLEDAAREFKRRFGRYPQELPELVTSGIIREVPKDTFGKGFFWESKEERVKTQPRE
jgi:tetratricopeptide (TPR) repeat protein